MNLDSQYGTDHPQLHHPGPSGDGTSYASAPVLETDTGDSLHRQPPLRGSVPPGPGRNDHGRRRVHHLERTPSGRRLEPRIARRLAVLASLVERSSGPVETADHTAADVHRHRRPLRSVLPNSCEHPHQVVTGGGQLSRELLNVRIVMAFPPLVGALPRLETGVVHLRGHGEQLVEAAMLRPRTVALHPHYLNRPVHRPEIVETATDRNPCLGTQVYKPRNLHRRRQAIWQP